MIGSLINSRTRARCWNAARSVVDAHPIADADPFPTALFQGLPFAHYAAEDAGATWVARHGLPLAMDRVGNPVLHNGWLDCAAGCYAATRDPWPIETPFELWALCQPNDYAYRQFYNGEAIASNNPISFATRLAHAAVYSGSYIRTYNVAPATGPRSYSWARTKAGMMSAVMSVYVAGQQVAASNTADRSTNASGEWFVVGGERDTTGGVRPRGLVVRDVILTVGWVLTDAQRAALETYGRKRIAV